MAPETVYRCHTKLEWTEDKGEGEGVRAIKILPREHHAHVTK
jgi:hypothetical protein